MVKILIAFLALFCVYTTNAQSSKINPGSSGFRGLSDQEVARGNIAVHKPNLRGNLNKKSRRTDFISPVWNSGKLWLSDSSIIEGFVNYDIAKDVVLVGSKDSVQIYTADQIWNFEIYRDQPRVRRNGVDPNFKKTKYFSLPYTKNNGSQEPKLFELVVFGNTSLLRRWKQGTAYYYRTLYLINEEGKITQIKKRRGSVIKAFDGKHEELKKIARKENLDMYEIRDVIRLVEAYNAFAEQNR